MILHTIRQLLQTDVWVGGPTGFGASIYSGSAPQDLAGYFVVLHLISQSEGHSHDGPNGFVTGRVQIDAWGDTYEKAHKLARGIHDALDGWKGTHPTTGLEIAFIEQEATRDLSNSTPRGGDMPTSYGVSTDFKFAHQQQPVTTPVPA